MRCFLDSNRAGTAAVLLLSTTNGKDERMISTPRFLELPFDVFRVLELTKPGLLVTMMLSSPGVLDPVEYSHSVKLERCNQNVYCF